MPRKSSDTLPKFSNFVVNNEPTEFCWEYISNLSKVVISKYFAKYLAYFDFEDLAQLATSDAVAFAIKIADTGTGDDIKNVRNVFFTRIRNTLSNFIFRSNKLVSTDDDILSRTAVEPKVFEKSSDLIDVHDLHIDSIDSFRSVSLNVWNLFKTNGARQHYSFNDSTNNLEDWKTYSEVKNMKTPCELIQLYNNYTEDQVEELASKLDSVTGQNYFNTLYQLLGDKFLAFLDVFQEDKFNIPSTVLVKHILLDISICKDYDDGMSIKDLSTKYGKSEQVIQRVIDSREVI